jgi:hypothetical protein
LCIAHSIIPQNIVSIKKAASLQLFLIIIIGSFKDYITGLDVEIFGPDGCFLLFFLFHSTNKRFIAMDRYTANGKATELSKNNEKGMTTSRNVTNTHVIA